MPAPPVTAVAGAAIRVRLVGAAARRALARSSSWRVLAVFRRSVYCQDERGALVCLGPPALGPGPLNLLCDLPDGDGGLEGLAGLGPGTRLRRSGTRLEAEGGLVADLGAALEWSPDPLPAGWRPDDLRQGLAGLAEAARRRAPVEGLGRLIPLLVEPDRLLPSPGARLRAAGGDPAGLPAPAGGARSPASRWSPAGDGGAAGGADRAPPGAGRARPGGNTVAGGGSAPADCPSLARVAWEPLVALAGWLRTAHRGPDLAPPPEAAAGLLGLGPGLTPSGDDAVGGALVALHALGRVAAARRLAAWALPRARVRTSALSRAHLAAAADGAGAAALHQVLGALVAGRRDAVEAALAAVAAVGHTSGWDALAGAAAACAGHLAGRRVDDPAGAATRGG